MSDERIDYHDLHNNILRVVVTALYGFEHPITEEMTAGEINMQDQRCLDAYRRDPLFNAKCQRLTSVIISIVQYHEDVAKRGKQTVEQEIIEAKGKALIMLDCLVSRSKGFQVQNILSPE